MAIREVILDTNTWVSFFYNSQLDKLVEIRYDKGIIIYSCAQQITELTTVLSRPKFKKKITLPIEEYVDFLMGIATIVDIEENFDRLEDPKDNYIIDLAYAVKADHIVSSDRHILSLKHLGRIQIISMTAFKNAIIL